MIQLMIQAADMRSQTLNKPRRQLIGIGSLTCGPNERRGTLYSGMAKAPPIHPCRSPPPTSAFTIERRSNPQPTNLALSKRLQVFQQCLFLVSTQLRSELVATSAVARIAVAAIGCGQGISA